MKYLLFFLSSIFLFSCSYNRQIQYLQDSKNNQVYDKIDYFNLNNSLEVGDILKIDVQTLVKEASIPYMAISSLNNNTSTLDVIKLEGYIVDDSLNINFPVLGKINVSNLSEKSLEEKITKLLLDGNHLTNPTVKVRRVNAKFTILGEVNQPGTYTFFESKLNIFQALGYSGDLTIDAKRKNLKLIRQRNGFKKIMHIDLRDSNLLSKEEYYIKNNDVIIVNPSYSKVKSAGFIGNPASFASIASLLLSISILITNN